MDLRGNVTNSRRQIVPSVIFDWLVISGDIQLNKVWNANLPLPYETQDICAILYASSGKIFIWQKICLNYKE